MIITPNFDSANSLHSSPCQGGWREDGYRRDAESRRGCSGVQQATKRSWLAMAGEILEEILENRRKALENMEKPKVNGLF